MVISTHWSANSSLSGRLARNPKSLSGRYRLPTFRALRDIGVIGLSRAAEIPNAWTGGRVRRRRHVKGLRGIGRFHVGWSDVAGLALLGHYGHPGKGSDNCQPNPGRRPPVAFMVMMAAAVVPGRATPIRPPVGMGGLGDEGERNNQGSE